MATRTKVDALKELGEKVTGSTLVAEENETIVGMIDKIAENYSGGGESGGIPKITENTNMTTLDGGLYAIEVGTSTISLQYGNDASKSFSIGGYNGISAYLMILNGQSKYICFECSGVESADAKIHYGQLGSKQASHLVFTLQGS